MPSPIDAATLQMALIGYQSEHSRIERKMAEIRSRLGGRVDPIVAKEATPKRILSVGARARIAAAQKKRWAAFHKGKKVAAVPEPPKAKSRISEEGLKRIIAATKKRWAAKRAAAAKPGHVTARKVVIKKAAVKTAPAKAAKKKAVKTVTAQATRAADSAPTPEVVAQ